MSGAPPQANALASRQAAIAPDSVTVSIVFVRESLARLPDALSRARVLASAGIPADLLQEEKARVSAQQFALVWLGVNRQLSDEFFGLDPRGMPPGAFQLICRSLVCARTLGQGLRRCLQAFSVFLPSIRTGLQESGDEEVLFVESLAPQAPGARFAQELLLTVIHGVMCWMAGQYVPFTRAEFAYPRPAHWQEYTAMFSRELRFDAPRTAMHFDARWLGRPLQLDDARCRAFVASAPLSIFVKYRNPDSWTSRVREPLQLLPLERWPVLQGMAFALNVAPATLARRLTEEGTSYQGIKDDLRRDRAVQLLGDTRLPVAEIAAELGFADASAFYRAFKRWTGALPGTYRAAASAG